jgi:hypothetical protein
VKLLGVLSSGRGRAFEISATTLHATGWLLGARHFLVALAAFAAAVVLLAIGASRGADWKRARLGVALVSVAFVLPALVGLGQLKMDLVERDRFRSYLAEHRCKYVGEAVVGLSRGGCRFEECADPKPIEDQQFF